MNVLLLPCHIYLKITLLLSHQQRVLVNLKTDLSSTETGWFPALHSKLRCSPVLSSAHTTCDWSGWYTSLICARLSLSPDIDLINYITRELWTALCKNFPGVSRKHNGYLKPQTSQYNQNGDFRFETCHAPNKIRTFMIQCYSLPIFNKYILNIPDSKIKYMYFDICIILYK